MIGPLPVDFEAKVKMPPQPAGNGYPYTISARDLMVNFKYLLDAIKSLPDGAALGDILYWSGQEWAVLPAPSSDDGMKVLAFTNNELQWVATEECP